MEQLNYTRQIYTVLLRFYSVVYRNSLDFLFLKPYNYIVW